jgi:hypothetical protein
VNLVEVLGAEALVHPTTDASPVITEEVADAFEDADAFEEYQEHHRGGFSMIARSDPRNLPKRHETIDVPFSGEELYLFDLDSGAALR